MVLSRLVANVFLEGCKRFNMKNFGFFSAKCRWLSLLAAFAVVGIHSRTTEWTPGVVDWSSRLQNFCIEHCSFAVPMFFMFSGYWFIKSYERYGFVQLLQKKFWSLYVPFVLWCAIGEFAVWPTSFWSDVPPSWGALLGVPILLTKGLSLAFHLWYVRALLIFFLLAPLCYLIGKHAILVLAAIVVTRFFPTITLGPYHFDYFALAVPWFFIGAGLSSGDWLSVRLKRKYSISIALLSFIALIGLDVCGNWKVPYFISAHEVRIALMIVFFWFGFDCFAGSFGVCHPLTVCSYTFFIYCLHVSVIRYTGNLLRVGWGTSPSIKTLGYFCNWLTFLVDAELGVLCTRFVPRLYRLLSGGR